MNSADLDNGINFLIKSPKDSQNWYVFRCGRHFGLFTTDQIVNLIEDGYLSLNHFVCQPGESQWTPISNANEFKQIKQNKYLQQTDEEFSEAVGLLKKDIIAYRQRLATLQSAGVKKENKYKIKGVGDLYDSIKQKLNFAISETMTNEKEK